MKDRIKMKMNRMIKTIFLEMMDSKKIKMLMKKRMRKMKWMKVMMKIKRKMMKDNKKQKSLKEQHKLKAKVIK